MTRFEELLEGHLAGDLAPEEEREFVALLAQEEHRRAFAAHQKTASLLEGARRVLPASATFTEEVMARLPERRPSRWERVSEILWAPRAFHWNLASALALGLVLAVAPIVWRALPDRSPDPTGPRPEATVIRFTLHAPGAERVSLVGDFNGWRSDEILLSDTTGRGHFSGALPLRPGRYAYMFVVDGSTWVTDPAAEDHRDDGFGNRNAVVTVSESEGGNDT